jgi:hypothetical protein
MRNTKGQPVIVSYDSGYEHSIEHWFETRRLVAEADAALQFSYFAPWEDALKAIHSCSYELYERRGRKDGHDLDDWLRAEGEVLAYMEVSASAAFKGAPKKL